MHWNCPRCGVLLTNPQTGAFRCPACGVSLRLRRDPKAIPAEQLQPRTPAPPNGPPGESRCPLHPDHAVSAACERCGDFICDRCTTPIEGRLYCFPCFDLLYRRGGLAGLQREFHEPKWALAFAILSLVSWLAPLLGLIPAALAFWMGISAWVRISREPELPGLRLAIAALIVAGASFSGALAWHLLGGSMMF